MKLAVLLSGSGRTLDNFHQAISAGRMQGEIALVISNQPKALGLEKASRYGYPAFHAPDNQSINRLVLEYQTELVLLAGFLKLYQAPESLCRSVLNIHPSLIPSFCGDGMYGMRVHRAVYNRGVTVSGCTVHFANEFYDEGPIVLQKAVELNDEDSPEIIASKVFAAECEAYPEAVNLVAKNGVDYYWNRRK